MIADLKRKAIFPHVVADLCNLCSNADEEMECDPSAPNFPWRALECAYRDVLEQALNLKALLMMEKEVMPVAGCESVPTKAEASPVVNPPATGEPDWRGAPDWAQWWAIDTQTGPAFWYSLPPIPGQYGWMTQNGNGRRYEMAPTFGYSGKWHESLHERPKTV